MYGLGRIAKNVLILGMFWWSVGEQKWPLIGHFESDDISVSEFSLGLIVIHIHAKYQPQTSQG